MTLAEVKRRIVAGAVFDVTNHYIDVPDHPSYGTQRRTVIRANSGGFYLTWPKSDHPHSGLIHWPRARQVKLLEDGTILLYGPFDRDTLFMTLRPVEETT